MRTRIRVLCVVDNLDVGGVREIVLSQLSSLDPDRFDPGLLTLADDLEKASELLPTHVTRLAARYRQDYGYGVLDYLSDGLLLRAAKRFGRDALREIDKFDPHILHFHTNPRDLGLGILANRRTPRALVFTDHLVRIRSIGLLAPRAFSPSRLLPPAVPSLPRDLRRAERCTVQSRGGLPQSLERTSAAREPGRSS